MLPNAFCDFASQDWQPLAVLCFDATMYFMRTTIDVPDTLFRRAKALAALRGASMKDLIVQALEREVRAEAHGESGVSARHVQFPLIRLRAGRKLDLSKFNFDDLLT